MIFVVLIDYLLILILEDSLSTNNLQSEASQSKLSLVTDAENENKSESESINGEMMDPAPDSLPPSQSLLFLWHIIPKIYIYILFFTACRLRFEIVTFAAFILLLNVGAEISLVFLFLLFFSKYIYILLTLITLDLEAGYSHMHMNNYILVTKIQRILMLYIG
jgi:hypothetical protein